MFMSSSDDEQSHASRAPPDLGYLPEEILQFISFEDQQRWDDIDDETKEIILSFSASLPPGDKQLWDDISDSTKGIILSYRTSESTEAESQPTTNENAPNFRETYAVDDEIFHYEERATSTIKNNYSFLLGDSSDRPDTAPAEQPVKKGICELFSQVRIGNNLRRRRDADDDEELSESAATELQVNESLATVGPSFDSEYGKKTAATLHAIEPDSNDLNPPSNKRIRVTEVVPEAPSSDVFQRLIPCQEPPSHKSKNDFAVVFMETLCDLWGVWGFLKGKDPRVEQLYALNKQAYEGTDLQLRYAIISTNILSDEDRIEVMLNPKAIGEYTVIEILSLWLASDDCMASRCGGGSGSSTLRNAWLGQHPYPIGRKDRVSRNDSRRTKLAKFYKHPNVILAMYLFEVITAYNTEKLRAHQTALGLQEHGYHWVILNDKGGVKRKVAIPCVDNEIAGMIRIAGLANAVVCGYYDVISDDNKKYTIGGVVYPLGIDFLSGPRCHVNHLFCFDSEELSGSYNANMCIALREHLSCSDVKVNVGNNEKCNGNTVTIINEYPKHVRTLHSECNCYRAPGNFSGSKCNFTSFRNCYSDASRIEKVTHNPSENESEYKYIGEQCYHVNNSDTVNDSENLRTLEDTRVKLRHLMGLPNNDWVDNDWVDNDETFNNELEYSLFPVLEGYSAAFFDLETTDLDAKTCRILELALVNLHEEIIHADYINPGVHEPFQITRGAFNIHGISKLKLAGKSGTKVGLEKMFDVLDSWRNGKKLCLFGHNIGRFDLQVLQAEAMRHDLGRRLKGISYVDTLDLLSDDNNRQLWVDNDMDRPTSFKLGKLYNHIFESNIPDHHSAVGDVLANAKILQKLDPNLIVSRKYINEFEQDKH